MPHFFLADNGSVRAAATQTLRQLARDLSARAGVPVQAVSLQHADRIDPTELGGEPATLLIEGLRAQLQQGQREFVLIPLFFGRSRALTSFVPNVVDELAAEFGEFQLAMTEVLYPLPEGDDALVNIVLDHAQPEGGDAMCAHQVLVDHGSPSPAVTKVREHIAAQLQQKAGDSLKLAQAVMERREGPDYDFNGPLLADWLRAQAQQGVRDIRVLMQFLLPGKHAGPGGDVVEICESVIEQYPNLRVQISPLISEHPALIDMLLERLKSAL